MRVVDGESGEVTARISANGRVFRRAWFSPDDPDSVSLYDYGVSQDGRLYYVMELLDGESVDRRMRRTPLGLLEALQISDQALDVLAVDFGDTVRVERDYDPAQVTAAQVTATQIASAQISSAKITAAKIAST